VVVVVVAVANALITVTADATGVIPADSPTVVVVVAAAVVTGTMIGVVVVVTGTTTAGTTVVVVAMIAVVVGIAEVVDATAINHLFTWPQISFTRIGCFSRKTAMANESLMYVSPC